MASTDILVWSAVIGGSIAVLYFLDPFCPMWGAHCEQQKAVSQGVTRAGDVVSKAIDAVAAATAPPPRKQPSGPSAGDKTGQKQAGVVYSYPALSVA